MAEYNSTKPHVNVGTLGHIDHGKTTLTSALVAYSKRKGWQNSGKTYAEIAKGGTARAGSNKIVTIAPAHVEYESEIRHYAHIDCPGHKDYIKNMITGAAQMDGAIICVSSEDGPMPQTKEHLLLARQIGVKYVVVFVNVFPGFDLDLKPILEEEMRDLLKFYGYDYQNAPIVFGSAKFGEDGTPEGDLAMAELLAAMDSAIPIPVRELDKPFIMAVEDVFNIPGRGTVATGKIERGRIKIGEVVEQMGLMEGKKEITITGIEAFKKSMSEAKAGDNVGLLIRGIKREEIMRGQILAAKGSAKTSTSFKSEILVLTKNEGGRATGFKTGYKPQFFIRTADITGSIELMADQAVVLPGDNAQVKITLGENICLEQGMTFAIREGGLTVGQGVITEILN